MDEKTKQELLDQIQEVSDKFYQNKDQDGVILMPSLIQKLTEVVNIVPQEQQSLYYAGIKNLLEAFESKNYVLIADILVYDISELI